MLLQRTVIAVHMVKLKTLVCIACTLVHRHVVASLLHLQPPFLHYARVNISENESVTDFPLSLLGQSDSLFYPSFEAFSSSNFLIFPNGKSKTLSLGHYVLRKIHAKCGAFIQSVTIISLSHLTKMTHYSRREEFTTVQVLYMLTSYMIAGMMSA